jgi:hypothetical protein
MGWWMVGRVGSGEKKRLGAAEKETRARVTVPCVHIRHHVDLSFCLCDFLLRGDLRAATEEVRHRECGLKIGCMC